MAKQKEHNNGNESTNVASIVASRSHANASGGTCQYVVVVGRRLAPSNNDISSS